jgi:MoxR-like ATPase
MTTLQPEEAVAVRDAARLVVAQVERAIVGKRDFIELTVMALLARGHILIEDIPGVGKTMLAKAVAKAIGGVFKRIQFTPDLLPGDVTGISIYDQKSTEFVFNPGPIFANVVVADEINRATPKTQSALLEAMQESQATVDGVTRRLPQPFFVIATQNPIEYRGTYPLPEAQMDRFLMRLQLGYPLPNEEVQMLARQALGSTEQESNLKELRSTRPLDNVDAVLTAEEICALQTIVERVHVSQAVREYIVSIAHATRMDADVLLGVSPRGSLGLQRAAQAAAAVHGRNFVTPDDVKALALPVLSHRLMMGVDAGRGEAAAWLLERLLNELPVPDNPEK